MDINSANVDLARGAVVRNRDVVVGIKARLSNNVAGTNDLEALRRAQALNLPVMIHIGQTYSPMRTILPLLKRGDRHPCVCAGTKRHPRRPAHPGGRGSAASRRDLRLRKWGRRSFQLGCRGTRNEPRFLA
jgi:hypothetical protein